MRQFPPGGADGRRRIRLRPLVLERLALYHIYLHDGGQRPEAGVVSSAQLAAAAGVDDTQVRKDLALIGVRGRPHVGFRRADIMVSIHGTLGLDLTHRAVIMGAGRLGGAIAEYPGFQDCGLTIVGLFDTDPHKIGTLIGSHIVRPLEDLRSIAVSREAQMAIVTCPAGAAQSTVDRVVEVGISVIWNFAPTPLSAPKGVLIRHEHILAGLAQLTHHLSRTDAEPAEEV